MEIAQKGNSKKEYILSYDIRDYENDPIHAPLNAFRKVVSYVDDTEPVKIDSARLMRVLSGLRVKDFKYYYYIINLLNRNDEPIYANHKEMRDYFKDPYVQTVSSAIDRLVKQGLIQRAPRLRGWYFINPVYAWKGNRLDYLNLDAFEDCT